MVLGLDFNSRGHRDMQGFDSSSLAMAGFVLWVSQPFWAARIEAQECAQPKPPWPNGQGVGLLIRRLRVRVPQGVHYSAQLIPGPAFTTASHIVRRALHLQFVRIMQMHCHHHVCARMHQADAVHGQSGACCVVAVRIAHKT